MGMNSTPTPVHCTSLTFSSFAYTENESCNKYPSFKNNTNISLTHCLYVIESNHHQACTAYSMLLCGYNGPQCSLEILPFGTPFQKTKAGTMSPLMFTANIPATLPECPHILPSTDLVPTLDNVVLDVSLESTFVWSTLIIQFTSYLPCNNLPIFICDEIVDDMLM